MPRYIDADKAIAEINKGDLLVGNNAEWAKEILNRIPAADVAEVKHGKWKIKQDEYDCEYMMCSVCKEEFYPVDADTVDTTPNYCPNCGAKMDGKKVE